MRHRVKGTGKLIELHFFLFYPPLLKQWVNDKKTTAAFLFGTDKE